MKYNEICKNLNCEYYIEWDYHFEEETQPYPCISCKLQGQSYDIEKIADNCPYKNRIIPQHN